MNGGRGSLIASLHNPPMRGPLTARRYVEKSDGASFHPPPAHSLPPRPFTTPHNATGSHMSFTGLQEELWYQHEVRLSDTVLDRLMQAAGGVAEKDRATSAATLAVGVAWEEHVLA